jgi:hypothetical protein
MYNKLIMNIGHRDLVGTSSDLASIRKDVERIAEA